MGATRAAAASLRVPDRGCFAQRPPSKRRSNDRRWRLFQFTVGQEN